MSRKAYPSDISDIDWQKIEVLLPAPRPIGRHREVNLREIINGIFYIQREGCSWRALPHDFPPWQTVYNYFRDWQRLGVWQKICKQLRSQIPESIRRTDYLNCHHCPFKPVNTKIQASLD